MMLTEEDAKQKACCKCMPHKPDGQLMTAAYGLRGMLEAPGLILSKAVSRWFDNEADLMAALYDDQPDEAGLGQYKEARQSMLRLRSHVLKLAVVAEAADAVMHHFSDALINENDNAFRRMSDAMDALRLALLDAGYGGSREQDEN